jgi:hypothetical protein
MHDHAYKKIVKHHNFICCGGPILGFNKSRAHDELPQEEATFYRPNPQVRATLIPQGDRGQKGERQPPYWAVPRASDLMRTETHPHYGKSGTLSWQALGPKREDRGPGPHEGSDIHGLGPPERWRPRLVPPSGGPFAELMEPGASGHSAACLLHSGEEGKAIVSVVEAHLQGHTATVGVTLAFSSAPYARRSMIISSRSSRAATWSGVSLRAFAVLTFAPRDNSTATECSMLLATNVWSGVFPSCRAAQPRFEGQSVSLMATGDKR